MQNIPPIEVKSDTLWIDPEMNIILAKGPHLEDTGSHIYVLNCFWKGVSLNFLQTAQLMAFVDSIALFADSDEAEELRQIAQAESEVVAKV